jgi:hypothetical protein
MTPDARRRIAQIVTAYERNRLKKIENSRLKREETSQRTRRTVVPLEVLSWKEYDKETGEWKETKLDL